jgi:hypothetical protein
MNGERVAGERTRLVTIGLVTLCVLLYQIAVTRLLSVVFWYHFAFLSISVAMLGLGASGVWLSLRPRGEHALSRALLLAGLSIPLSVSVIVKAWPFVTELGLGQSAFIGAVIAAMLVPMGALGAAVCLLLISAEGGAVGRMYAADLFGATLGALLVIPALSAVPTPTLLVLTGLLPLAALALAAGARTPAWIVAACAIIGLAAWGEPFRVGYSKLYVEQGQNAPLHEIWTPTARITVFERPIYSGAAGVAWGWGYGSRFVPEPTEERWIDQDGSAGTPIERVSSAVPKLAHLLFDVTSVGYQIVAPANVCVIGAGGGRDVLTALATGARSVDAVELNAAIVDLLRGPLAAFSGDLYRRRGVHAVVSEGRSFLTRTDKRYDLIQISLVDSWAATAAGAYSLSENYLYTVEALRLYLHRLEPGGVLSISRWTDGVQPFESARLMLLAEEALRQEGAADPREHLLFVSGGQVGTLIAGRQPLAPALRARADQVAAERGFVRQWPPPAGPPRPSMVAIAMADGGATLRRAGLDLTPPVDDRPFFFQTSSVFRIGGEDPSAAVPTDISLESVKLLRVTLFVLAAIAFGAFFLPFALFARPQRGPAFWAGSAYFGLVGFGFMLLELPFIQVAVLFLGHPSYAAAVVLAALLLGAGTGSMLTARDPARAGRLFVLVAPASALVSLGMAPLFRAALAYPLALRVAIAAGLFGAVGVLLGSAVPLGFLRFGDARKPWFWAINGAASVCASALSIALAMSLGFTLTALAGAGCYLLAAVLMRAAARARV